MVTCEIGQNPLHFTLGQGRDMFFDFQMRQKGTYFSRSHLTGMAFIVKENETFNPIDIGEPNEYIPLLFPPFSTILIV
jgi:hypothetical protein